MEYFIPLSTETNRFLFSPVSIQKASGLLIHAYREISAENLSQKATSNGRFYLHRRALTRRLPSCLNRSSSLSNLSGKRDTTYISRSALAKLQAAGN